MRRNQKQSGFTLIELLVAIAVVGMLSSVIYANTSSARAKARDAKRLADMHNIVNALELYRSTYGTYPQNETEYGAGTWMERWDASSAGSFIPPLISAELMAAPAHDPSHPNGTYLYVDVQPRPTDTYGVFLATAGSCNSGFTLAFLQFYLETDVYTQWAKCNPYSGSWHCICLDA